MNQKDGLIDQNTPDCIGCGEVIGGFITREVVDGFIGNGVEG